MHYIVTLTSKYAFGCQREVIVSASNTWRALRQAKRLARRTETLWAYRHDYPKGWRNAWRFKCELIGQQSLFTH